VYDNQQQPKGWPLGVDRAAEEIAGAAARTVRQLLPFPGADAGTLPLMLPLNTITAQSIDPAAPVSNAPGDIISQAAAILDQEIAKGLVAAKQAPAPAPVRTAAPADNVVQQLRDVIDNIARIWPASPIGAFPRPAAPTPAGSAAAPLPELKPATPLRPGDQATMTMTIRNHEAGPVSLAPAATPLLGSNGERIPVQLLELTPAQLRLDPGQEQELRITVTVPARCGSGCYAGLLVVSGVDYLRALITVHVSPRE
jgi:hypothetical protein